MPWAIACAFVSRISPETSWIIVSSLLETIVFGVRCDYEAMLMKRCD
jgi:hypothetical protein